MSFSLKELFSTRNSLLFCAAIALTTLYLFNGTGKEGDSIEHYLYAKFAFKHPELFLNHWGKPLFTLLASPFAQFGFVGIKVFNSICALGAAYYSIQIAKKLNLNYWGLAAIFYFIFPLSFLTTYSGLTEPLFAFVLCFSIYKCFNQQIIIAALALSFTPFIRSEGLVILAVFAAYFIYLRNWKALVLLASAHILMSIVGAFYYQNLLWVFEKIPYATLSTPYGKGTLVHFFTQLNGALGIPLYILFWLGVLTILIKQFSKKLNHSSYYNLILTCFFSFFIAHTLFWYLGIFNSMGLRRVFAAVTPLMALIALIGFNQLVELMKPTYRKYLVFGLLRIIFLFPFSANRAAVEWEKLNLSTSQNTAIEVVDFITKNQLSTKRYIYTDSYLGELLKIDPFDHSQRAILSPQAFPIFEKGDVIIWDNWHSVVDYGVQLEQLRELENLEERFRITNEQSTYVVFEVIPM